VRAALLKRMTDVRRPLPPYRWMTFADLLGHAESTLKIDQGGGNTNLSMATGHALRLMEDTLRQALPTLPPAKAAELLAQAFSERYFPLDDEGLWRLVLRNAAAMSASAQDSAGCSLEMYCRWPGLVPDLKAVVQNDKLSGILRGGAIVALHLLGVDGYLDVVAADIVRPEPQFRAATHALLGDYKAKEVAAGLVTLLASPNLSVRVSAAMRIQDFGVAVSPADLMAALRVNGVTEADYEGVVFCALLDALALQDPVAALPFIREAVGKEACPSAREQALRLAACLDQSTARDIVMDVFHTGDDAARTALARAIGAAWWSSVGPPQPLSSANHRRVPGTHEHLSSYFPPLLDLYGAAEPGALRQAVGDALRSITGLGGQSHPLPEDRLVAEWQAWWAENHARFAR
jgi:hypothetical protein